MKENYHFNYLHLDYNKSTTKVQQKYNKKAARPQSGSSSVRCLPVFSGRFCDHRATIVQK